MSTKEPRRFLSWNPTLSLIRSIRDYQSMNSKIDQAHSAGRVLCRVGMKSAVLRHIFWSTVCGCDIPINSKIGSGFNLKHSQGVVIHPDCMIGKDCTIMSQVVIGTSGKGGVPAIGDNVMVGSGAKILGPIVIGSGVTVGANAVVLCDVADNETVVGICLLYTSPSPRDA